MDVRQAFGRLAAGFLLVASTACADQKSEDADVEEVPQGQVDAFLRAGVSYEQLLTNYAPAIFPQYQRTGTAKVKYRVMVLRDPDRVRRVRMEYGDGTMTTFSVPKGRNIHKTELSHTFPKTRVERFIQRVTIEPRPPATEGPYFLSFTDVCPPGLSPAPSDAPAAESSTPCQG